MPPPYLLIDTTPSNPYFRPIRPSRSSPITPTPLTSRNLSPHSTNSLNPSNPINSNTNRTYRPNPPPPTPGPWTWTCHHCGRTYRLTVTSRCLHDGHTFCSGTTVMRKWRTTSVSTSGEIEREQMIKKIRHDPCTSEFDYAGWSRWGLWRRRVGEGMGCERGGEGGRNVGDVVGVERGRVKKDCWNTCDYPSECRWGRRHGMCTLLEEEDEEDISVFYADATTTSSLEESENMLMAEKPDEVESPSSLSEVLQEELAATAEESKTTKKHASSSLGTIVEEDDAKEDEIHTSSSTISSDSSISEPSPINSLKALVTRNPTFPTFTKKLHSETKKSKRRRKSRMINDASSAENEGSEETLLSFPALTRVASRP